MAQYNASIDDKIKLKLIIKHGEPTKYYFRLVKQQLLTLKSKHTSSSISIKIPECFKIGDTIFKIKGQVVVKYQNLELDDSANVYKIGKNKGYFYIPLKITKNLNENKICLEDMCMQVCPAHNLNNDCCVIGNIGDIKFTNK